MPSKINFGKYGGQKRVIDVADPLKLFESLDRKTSHTALRPVQTEALKALATRRNEKDLVLKISTGAGKTTVALLFLRSHAAEKKQPVVYLCPTTQLVSQVLAEAQNLGLKAVEYPAGQRHPDPSGTAGEAIIVCTYDKLFNARTTFERTDVNLVPTAIVLDDAHAGIDRIRDAFTIRLSGSSLHEKLLSLLREPLKAYMPGLWTGIERQDSTAVIEAPYWVSRPLVEEMRNALADHAEDDELKFVWGHLRERLEWCRFIVSGAGIEITPEVLPVETVRGYASSSHRLFMSATLADDSALVREMACDSESAKKPVIPESDAGVGERMVLVPTLIDPTLNRDWVMEWCKRLAASVRVVVLAPSTNAAQRWDSVGATVVVGDEVDSAIQGLRDGRQTFVAFANRYDGIDLPDDSCRVLVIDGMPWGESITARRDAELLGGPRAAQNRLVHRIEQGMGRAVRSHVDYAVVILSGPDIANFVAKGAVLDLFNPATRAQVKLAQELAQIGTQEAGGDAATAASNLLWSCLQRDEAWKDFYDQRVRRALPSASAANEYGIALAQAERLAARQANGRDAAAAADTVEGALNHAKDELQKGWYLQVAAGYRYVSDQAAGLHLQASAYAANDRLLVPPAGSAIRRGDPGAAQAATAVLKWYGQYDNPNGAVAAFQDVRSRASFEVGHDTLEEALRALALFFGAQGSRPEKDQGRGPDDLWIWPDLAWVMEAKNEAVYERLPKKDSGQMHDSLQWFKDNYATMEPTPVMVARTVQRERDAHFPTGTKVFTPERLATLLDNIAGFLAELVRQPAAQLTTTMVAELQARHRLTSKQFSAAYTERLK